MVLSFSPNDLEMEASMVAKGKKVASKKIGASTVSVCLPNGTPPGICLDIQRVHIEKDSAEMCSKMVIKAGPKELMPQNLPCVVYNNGQFETKPNTNN